MADKGHQRRVLLIGWDAADWEHITPLIEEGLMPTLDAFINRGVMGNLATLQPILSPMLWNSVATGKFADKHGIHGFIEPDPVNGGARPYTSTSRKCKALWNILTQRGLRSNIVGWWASHPAEPIKGTVVTNAFGGVKFDPEKGWSIPKGTVHPAENGPKLARFKVFPNELTEPETTVILCSDHGFESGSQRPHGTPREPAGPAVWHRQYGIFVMAGPGVKRDERIYGASLIDVAPTVLTLFDIPIGEDMDGRPLLEAFELPPSVKTIPSWEKVPGECGMHVAGQQIDREQANELMQQFAALGYIEDPSADKEKMAESAEIEAKYNVARTYLWKNRPDQAQPLLQEIVRRRPWEDRFLTQLAACYYQGGYLAQAERVLFAEPGTAGMTLLWARI